MGEQGRKKRATELIGGEDSPAAHLVATFRHWLRLAFVENAALKFVALVLALTVFVLVQSEEAGVYYPRVKITYSPEGNRVLVSKRVDEVQLSLRGTRRRIKRLQKSRIENYHIDLQALSTGELRLDPEQFDLPEGVELLSISPPTLYLEFDDRAEKTLPVTPKVSGTPARGYRLGSLATNPKEIRVAGARQVLADIDEIHTEKVSLTDSTMSFDRVVELDTRGLEVVGFEKKSANGVPVVEVSVSIVEEVEARTLDPKVVELRSKGASESELKRFRLDPAKVVITMNGGLETLKAVDASKVTVYVEVDDLKDLNLPYPLPVRVEPKLPDIAYKTNPMKVTLQRTE
jgi:YbbR domain-containing protein